MSSTDLPPLSSVERFSDKYYEIASHFSLRGLAYCSNAAFLKLKPELNDWCEEFDCFPPGKCIVPKKQTPYSPPSSDYNHMDLGDGIIFDPRPGCYDVVFCPPRDYSEILHLVFGVFGLFVSLFGLLANSLALPAFSFHGRLSGTEVYLMGIVIADIVYLIFTMLLRLGPYISSDYVTQVNYYSRFSVHLIPWLGPLEDLARVASTWLVLGLLFDRFIYIRYGMAAKESYTRKRVSLILSVLMLCLGAYQLPRIFEFVLICNHEGPGGTAVRSPNEKNRTLFPSRIGMRVTRSWMGQSESFLNLIYSHLRIPINYTMPIIFTGVFFVLICIRLPSREEGVRTENLKNRCIDPDSTMLPLNSHMDLGLQYRRKLIYMRERRFVELSLFLGAVLIFQLVFYLLYDCLRLESNESPPWQPNALQLPEFRMWELCARVIDFLFPALRPIAYAFTCHEYMRALRDMFCCRKSEESEFYSVDFKDAKSYEEIAQIPPIVTSQQDQASERNLL